MTQQTILDFLKSNKTVLQEQYGVKQIGLVGSYARDEATPQSDIDIVVDMPSSFSVFFGLKSYLESHFNKSVDLGMLHSLRSFIKEEIKNEIIYV